MSSTSANNVVTLLAAAARRVGDRDALVIEKSPGVTHRITFAELWDRIDRVSAGLRARGLEPGQRAIIMIPMSIELYVVLLGVLKMGAVAVFVDPWIGRRQIAAFAAFADPSAYLGIPKSHVLRLMDSQLRQISLSVTTGSRLLRFPARWSLAELTDQPGDGGVHPVAVDDPALITFTGGSSGVPKGANRTHGFLTAQHRALQHEFPYAEDDIDMPMFPVFALNNLAMGMTSIVPTIDFKAVADTDGRIVLDQIERHDVTTCTASPPFIDRVVVAVAESAAPRQRLRRILTGGAPVTDRQLQAWRQTLPNTETIVVYGSTEAEPVAHIDAVARLAAEPAGSSPTPPGYCVGRPTELIETRIIRIEPGPIDVVADTWEAWQLGPGQIGELIVAGEHVCRDYYLNPQAIRENKLVDADGTIWHRMGDTGYFDTEQRFWLVGRVHSTIVRGGQFVHPQLVEQAARGNDARIRRVAAVGLPDASLGERVVVVVESPGRDENLRDDVGRRLEEARQTFDEIKTTARPLPVDPRHNSKIDYETLKRSL